MRLVIAGGVLLARGLDLRKWAFPYHDGLQHADFLDGIGKLTKIILVENSAWLMQVGSDITQAQFNQVTTLHRQQFRFVVLCIFVLFYRSGFT